MYDLGMAKVGFGYETRTHNTGPPAGGGVSWPGLTDGVRVAGQGVKYENGVGRIRIELTEGFIRDAHMRNVIPVLGGKRTNLAEGAVAQVIAIAPRAGDRWRSTQRRLKGLRDEGRGKRLRG
jgi:hypothetical protein